MPKMMLTSGCAVKASAATVTALSFNPEPSTDCAITASGSTDLRPAAKPSERATVVDSAGRAHVEHDGLAVEVILGVIAGPHADLLTRLEVVDRYQRDDSRPSATLRTRPAWSEPPS